MQKNTKKKEFDFAWILLGSCECDSTAAFGRFQSIFYFGRLLLLLMTHLPIWNLDYNVCMLSLVSFRLFFFSFASIRSQTDKNLIRSFCCAVSFLRIPFRLVLCHFLFQKRREENSQAAHIVTGVSCFTILMNSAKCTRQTKKKMLSRQPKTKCRSKQQQASEKLDTT